MKNIKTFMYECYFFNTVAGKDNQVSWKDIQFQVDLMQEEVKETFDDAQNKDIKGVLDGAIDTLVTTFGLIQKLEHLGADTSKAAKLIAENNNSKFTEDYGLAVATKNTYEAKGIEVDIVTCEMFKDVLYVIKRKSDGKVMKPNQFVSVDLEECVQGVKVND